MNLPTDTLDYQLRLSHDKDELEMKLKNARVDLITSLVGLLPFSLILSGVKDFLFIVNFLRILRLVKILPLYRTLNYLKKYNVNMVRLVEIILSYYVVAHIVACVMLSVGLAFSPNIENTWLNKIPVPMPSNVTRVTDISGVDRNTLYIHGIYFSANTISHVAIGDLTSVSTSERALNAFIIWCLTFFYALLFANISSVFSGGNNFLNFH